MIHKKSLLLPSRNLTVPIYCPFAKPRIKEICSNNHETLVFYRRTQQYHSRPGLDPNRMVIGEGKYLVFSFSVRHRNKRLRENNTKTLTKFRKATRFTHLTLTRTLLTKKTHVNVQLNIHIYPYSNIHKYSICQVIKVDEWKRISVCFYIVC
jgi:hypothetical protein